MADGRYSSIHMSAGALRALDFPDDTDFGIIPPFDDGQQPLIAVPPELDPPKPDDDDTLPSKAHPSYPYGAPYSLPPSTSSTSHFSHPFPSSSSSFAHPTWSDLALRDLLPHEMGKEIPPGMAGAKRGPQEDMSEDGGERGDDGGFEEEESGEEEEEGEGEGEETGEDGTVGEGEERSWEGGSEEQGEEEEEEVRDLDDDISGSEEADDDDEDV